MKRMGFYYDQTRCVGCNACQIACKDYHDLEKGLFFRRASTWEAEEDEKLTCIHYTGACNHCSNPLCLKNCPVQAIHQKEDGTVVQDPSACIGCGTCTWVCPYGAPSLSRMRGTAVKCDGCFERRAKGLEPVCVEACITHCLQVVDFDELSDDQKVVREMPFLPKEDISDPAIAIRPRVNTEVKSSLPKEVLYAEKTDVCGDIAGKKCLVLGGGIAGVTAAETLRELSKDSKITILSAEEEYPYSRPLLSKTYIKSLDVTKILIKPVEWYGENNINLVRSAVVEKMDTDKKCVYLKDGRTFEYDVCIYALGASPWTPPMEGLPMKGVYCIRTAEDMNLVHKYMGVSKTAIVLGGGVIGLEMAEELKQMGLAVTVLEAAPRLMGRLLDQESSAVLKKRLNEQGIVVEEGVTVECVAANENGRLSHVVLKDGRMIPAGVMVVSCGIRANISLAQDAGIICERGVVVDDKMATSDPFVFAAGDCISYRHMNPGLWGFSKETAVIAAQSALECCGDNTIPSSAEVMMSTGGISVFASGNLEEKEGIEVTYGMSNESRKQMQEFGAIASAQSQFLVNHRPGEEFGYQKYYRKDGKLVGAVLMGDLSMLASVKKELQEGGK